MRFCPLASGSSGNCVYVGVGDTHLLVDAGLSGKRIQGALGSIGVEASLVSGIFLTHEHSDHITGAGVMSRRFGVPVFASPKTWRYLERHGVIGVVAEENRRVVVPGESFLIGEVEVGCFDVPHDASQPVAYSFSGGGYTAAVATDMGYATDTVRGLLRCADVMLVECNHDLEMLQNGPYPQSLKERVMGSRGHLSNVACGALLAEVGGGCRHVFLGHLSEENNRPMIALDTVRNILEANDVQGLRISVAERHEPSEVVELGLD